MTLNRGKTVEEQSWWTERLELIDGQAGSLGGQPNVVNIVGVKKEQAGRLSSRVVPKGRLSMQVSVRQADVRSALPVNYNRLLIAISLTTNQTDHDHLRSNNATQLRFGLIFLKLVRVAWWEYAKI